MTINKTFIKKHININIIITNKNNIKSLNKKYRHKKKATDILTFKDIINKKIYADILICKKIMNERNKNLNKAIIHGILHLLNYTHNNNYDEKIMKKLEKIIGMSGIEPPTITTSK